MKSYAVFTLLLGFVILSGQTTVRTFSNPGKYKLITQNGAVGVQDSLGNTVIPVKYNDIFETESGIVVYDGKNYGAFDFFGKEILPFKYAFIEDISHGFAKVLTLKREEPESIGRGVWQFLDLNTGKLLPKEYSYVNSFKNGFLKKNERLDDKLVCGYLNTDFVFLSEERYQTCYNFSEGFAAVQSLKNKSWSYISTNLTPAFSGKKFASAASFSEGLAAVKNIKNNLYGYVNRKGELEIPYQFKASEAGHFSDGIARITMPDESVFYINTKGEKLDQHTNFLNLPTFGECSPENTKENQHCLYNTIAKEFFTNYDLGVVSENYGSGAVTIRSHFQFHVGENRRINGIRPLAKLSNPTVLHHTLTYFHSLKDKVIASEPAKKEGVVASQTFLLPVTVKIQ